MLKRSNQSKEKSKASAIARWDRYRETLANGAMKTCRKCGTLFNELHCLACQRVMNAKHYAANPDKVNVASKEWREKNKGRANEAARKRYAINREKENAQRRRYRADDPERFRAYDKKWSDANPAKLKAKHKRELAEHPEKFRIACHNRRAKIKGNGGKLSKGIAEKLLKFQRGKCACCKADLAKAKPHLDHRIALTNGGKNEDSNMQLLCSACNHSKGSQDPIMFMQSRGFLL